MQIDTLVVPTDFSENAGWALETATALAVRRNARIELLHSCHIRNPYGVKLPRDIAQDAREAAQARLEEIIEAIAAEGVEAAPHVVDRPAPEATAELVVRTSASCVVMGTRGLTGLKHVVLGSTADRTLRLAPCPVLTIGHRPDSAPGPPRRLLVPTDFSELGDRSIEVASRLALDAAAEPEGATPSLTLLHAFALPPMLAAHAAKERLLGFGSQLEAKLDERAAQLGALGAQGIEVKTRVIEATAAEAITTAATEEQADWIVMGTHGRTGLAHLSLGSVAERVVRLAPCPTLTLKDVSGDEARGQ